MKSLYESILDDEEVIIGNAEIHARNHAKLNEILDKLHNDTLELLNPAPGEVRQETNLPSVYDDFECYTLAKKRSIIHLVSSLFINTYKESNSKIDGELWSQVSRGTVSMFYIPRQGGRILVYRYCQRPHGINREVAIFKKVF